MRLARNQRDRQNRFGFDILVKVQRACLMLDTIPAANLEIDALLRDASQGDLTAVRSLLEKHRERLRRMIAARLDRRLAPRLDPSDVVQDTLADAARRLPDYLRDRPLPFYPWLYRLAADRLVRTHKHHVSSTVRGIGREERIVAAPHDKVAGMPLLDGLAANDTTPGRRMAREERRLMLAGAIERMDEADQEVLRLRYLDQLAFDEIASVLDIGLSAAKMRHLRALERLRPMLEELGLEPSTSP
jgi:RNA polymerase sigma-70 factor, ECF subfamily